MQSSPGVKALLEGLALAVGRELQPGELLRWYVEFSRISGDRALQAEFLQYVAISSLQADRVFDSVLASRIAAEVLPDPISYVSLAGYLEASGDLKGARSTFAAAFNLARSEKKFINYAAMAVLRFCARTQDQQFAEHVIDQLVEHRSNHQGLGQDIPLEADLVDSLRALRVSDTRLSSLMLLLSSKRT